MDILPPILGGHARMPRLRLFGPPRPDPGERAALPSAARNTALWIAAVLLAVEAAFWLPGLAGWAREAAIGLGGLVPARVAPPGAAWVPCATDACRALAGSATPQAAEPWRLASYVLVHTGPLHVLVNALALVWFAPPLVLRFGAVRFALFCALAGVASGLAVLVGAAFSPGAALVPVVGASGVVFGVWLGGLRIEWDRLRRLPPRLRAEPPGQVLACAAFWGLGLNLWLLALGTAVSSEAHIGGALFGFACAPLFQRPAYHAARRRRAALRALQADSDGGEDGVRMTTTRTGLVTAASFRT